MGLYYFYLNWTAGKENKIHRADCGHCNFGLGKRSKQVNGSHGVWVGPFASQTLAKEIISKRFGKDPDWHSCCK
jgi:hypothetical protein